MNQTEYQSQDAVGLAGLVAKGEVSPVELLDLALERTAEVNPAINAVVFADRERAMASIEAGLPDGPLRGVPFLLKDLYIDCVGFPMTNGSRFFAENVSNHDHEMAVRYKEAGLVIFGRSTSPEFGVTPTTESIIHGATRNPWNLEHTSGGSSGGASAAVAAGILPAANASDGGGSIRIPATCCGLFGIKPTRGRTPMGPDVGEGWAGMSTIHAVSRSVRDNAALLDATAGPDTGAPYWAPPPARPFLDEVGAGPGRLRIAIQTKRFNRGGIDPDCLAAVEDAAKLCQELGHEVEEAPLEIDMGGSGAGVIISANLRASVLERGQALGRDVTEADIEPITWGMFQSAAGDDAAAYASAVRSIHRAGRQVARFMERYDVILSPTMATPPAELGVLALTNTDESFGEAIGAAVAFTSLFNATGNPAMSVPLWWNDAGLPIGTQFAGRYGDEATLFRLAAQLEEARPWFERRPPI